MEKTIFLGEGLKKEDSGFKALRLDELTKLDCPVPNGFVTKTTLLPKQVDDYVRQIGGYPVAVRSSGIVEDLEDASFAGLYETYLNCRNAQEVSESIQKCLDSAKSERVYEYLKSKKLNTHDVPMGVLIQKMVQSQKSGVLFTRPPMSGKEEHFYFEVIQGLGERLVSGHATPSRYEWDWKEEQIVSADVNKENTILKTSELIKLSQWALKIQAHYGLPQDIEWAIDENGKIWILQTRPITYFSPRKDVTDHTNADLKDGGISARVCTPFMFSVYEKAMEPSMGGYLKKIRILKHDEQTKWISSFYGRAYWNAGAVKEALSKLPGFDEKSFDEDLGIQKNYGDVGAHKTPLNLITLMQALPVLNGLVHEFNDCLSFNSQFKNWFENQDDIFIHVVHNLEDLSNDAFLDWEKKIYEFQLTTEKAYFRTIYNNSNFQTEFKNKLKKIDPNGLVSLLNLMTNLEGVPHLKIQKGLQKIKEKVLSHGWGSFETQMALEEFIRENYHHGDAELDLMEPRWGEVPHRIQEMVELLINSNVQTTTHKSEEATIEEEVKKLDSYKNNPTWKIWGRRNFIREITRLRHFLKEREEMRTLSTRAYFLLRLIVLERMRRYKMKDIFFYTRDEILSSIQLPEDEILKRKLFYEGYRYFKAPNEFGGEVEQVKVQDSGDHLKGIACSPGTIEARAFVANTLEEAQKIKKEEVLITPFTDPGWTPILARISGVVTEVGGILSHAAVIGREYQIPAVLNIPDVTKKISTGDFVRINGSTGIVTILEKSSKC